jgi:hypothetical protein
VIGTSVYFGGMTGRGRAVILFNFIKSCDHKKRFFLLGFECAPCIIGSCIHDCRLKNPISIIEFIQSLERKLYFRYTCCQQVFAQIFCKNCMDMRYEHLHSHKKKFRPDFILSGNSKSEMPQHYMQHYAWRKKKSKVSFSKKLRASRATSFFLFCQQSIQTVKCSSSMVVQKTTSKIFILDDLDAPQVIP